LLAFVSIVKEIFWRRWMSPGVSALQISPVNRSWRDATFRMARLAGSEGMFGFDAQSF